MSRSFGGPQDPKEDPQRRAGQPGRPAYRPNSASSPLRQSAPSNQQYQPSQQDQYNQAPYQSGYQEDQPYDASDNKAAPERQVDLGKRFVAGLVDVVIGYLLGLIMNCIPFINVYIHDQIVLVLYLCVKDFLFDGRGIGKNLMGLQVVDLNGNPASLIQSFKRNAVIFAPFLLQSAVALILRFIPVDNVANTVTNILTAVGTIYYLIVLPIELYRLYSRADGRRLGDEFAGTVIVPADMDFSSPLAKR